MDEGLRVTRHDHTVWVDLTRAHDHHRITDGMLNALLHLCDLLRDDAQASVVVIRGEGDVFFSSGLLNPVLRGNMSKEQVLSLVRKANRVFDAIEALPQVVVGALNGNAVAGGVELALACDIRYAASHAVARLPEAGWGGFPGAGAPVRLATLVGKAHALDMIAGSEPQDAAEMLRIGLVQRVWDRATFDAELARCVARMAGSGPLALKGAKRVAAIRQEPGFWAARQLSDALRHSLEYSEDVDEGLAAAKEQRPPHYKGR
jgi:enoyl-CoA hydratase/carnithine racemase